MKRMKRIGIVWLLIFSLVLSGSAPEVGAKKKKKVTVDNMKASYVIMDASTGEVLASHKAARKVYPASTTKVLTVVTMVERIEQKGIQMDDYVKVTKKMLKSVPYGSKCAYLRKKHWYTYRDLIGLVMVVSAADAVKVLEKAIFGSEANLVQAMNEKAQEIGMTSSYFDNGIGLDKANGYPKIHTTAADMMKLEEYASNNCDVINEMSKKKKIVVKDKTGKVVHALRSTNLFYRTVKYPKKRYKVVGMKTGYTNLAGVTLLTKAVRKMDGHEILVAVFHVKGNENVYENTRLLLNQYCK